MQSVGLALDEAACAAGLLALLLDSSQLELENVEQVGECDVGMMFMLWSINLGRIVVIMEIDDRSRW